MNLLTLCNTRVQTGMVGIEVEVEGKRLPPAPVGWKKVGDGSLRGESAEYVLKAPVTVKRIPIALNRMKAAYEDANTRFIPSRRQSIHVHINVQEMELNHIFNFIILFLLFEESLVEFCGENRVANLYCLRSKDAEGLVYRLEEASSANTFNMLDNNQLRYSALNVASMFKFGSLEFRSMEGTDDWDRVREWIDILLLLKEEATKYANPLEMAAKFSELGAVRFSNELFDNTGVQQLSESKLYSSLRDLQILMYEGDWKSFEGRSIDVLENNSRLLQFRIDRDALNDTAPSLREELEEEEEDDYE